MSAPKPTKCDTISNAYLFSRKWFTSIGITEIEPEKLKKALDKLRFYDIITELIANAVIAQSVERILGKDEVPGSNPGNSSSMHRT